MPRRRRASRRPDPVEKPRRVAVELSLIALERKHVVGPLIDDRLRDIRKAAGRVNGHDSTCQFQHLQQPRQRAGLIGGFRDGLLTEDQFILLCPGADHPKRLLAGGPVVATAQGLPVDGNELTDCVSQRGDPLPETSLELLRVNPAPDAT